MSPLQWDSLILANFHFCRRCDLFLFFFRCRPATRPQTLPKHTRRGPVRRPFCRRIFLAPRQSFLDLFCMVTSNFKNMSRVRPSIRRTPPHDVISSGLPGNFSRPNRRVGPGTYGTVMLLYCADEWLGIGGSDRRTDVSTVGGGLSAICHLLAAGCRISSESGIHLNTVIYSWYNRATLSTPEVYPNNIFLNAERLRGL